IFSSLTRLYAPYDGSFSNCRSAAVSWLSAELVLSTVISRRNRVEFGSRASTTPLGRSVGGQFFGMPTEKPAPWYLVEFAGIVAGPSEALALGGAPAFGSPPPRRLRTSRNPPASTAAALRLRRSPRERSSWKSSGEDGGCGRNARAGCCGPLGGVPNGSGAIRWVPSSSRPPYEPYAGARRAGGGLAAPVSGRDGSVTVASESVPSREPSPAGRSGIASGSSGAPRSVWVAAFMSTSSGSATSGSTRS